MPRDLDVAFRRHRRNPARRRFRARPRLHRPHAASARPRGDAACSAPPPCGRSSSGCCPAPASCSRPRLSQLTFAGEKKLTRLPRRSAIVAFSADEVYAIAELIRRQRGGAAVVLGALSPRTRNAQVALYQSGDVDYPGRDRRHRHGAQSRRRSRRLRGRPQVRRLSVPQAQPGRARRRSPAAPAAHRATAPSAPPAAARRSRPSWSQALERHTFEPVKIVQWRNTDLDFSSLGALQATLAADADRERRSRARRSPRTFWCSSMPRATTTCAA